jgi:hypothetical protein
MGCGESGGKVTPVQPGDLIDVTLDGVQHPSAFGELPTSDITPNIQIQFTYGINNRQAETRANASGSATVTQGLAAASTGASADSGCEVVSRRVSKYRTGQGSLWRGAGFFTTGVAGNTQLLGIGNAEDGLFFGYNGTAFGILHRRGGGIEVRTLTVTTKSSDAENITITLDGVAKTDVAVTNGADTTVTANEIAAADYSDVGVGWKAVAVGATVVFQSWGSGAKSGTYSLSSATSAVGTFAQTLAGNAPTDTWIAQADWNKDVMDGTGSSGITLDTTKGNVYQIQYQWLGFGILKFFIENGETGKLVEVHDIQYSNLNTITSFVNPSLPCYMGVINTTNTTDVSITSGSFMAGTQGVKELAGVTYGQHVTASPGTASEVPVLSIRNMLIFQGQTNRVDVKLTVLNSSVEHNKPVVMNFYIDATLVAASWSDIDAASSVVQFDTAATSFTGGTEIFSMALGRTGNDTVELVNKLVGLLAPGQTLTVTAVPESGTTHIVGASLNWIEDF